MFEEAGPGNVDGCIDRVHQVPVGKTYVDEKSSKKCKSIIVQFTTLRHCTKLFWPKPASNLIIDVDRPDDSWWLLLNLLVRCLNSTVTFTVSGRLKENFVLSFVSDLSCVY